MAGIYIHIPFCRTICSYCDFFKSASLAQKADMINALKKEIKLRKAYLDNKEIETIYFGGGTPSVMNIAEISLLINEINKYYKLIDNVEISFEANPDDLDKHYLNDLFSTGINRLSIGCQSFNDNELRLLERRHDGRQAINSVYNAAGAGFKNINIDLIYGIPGENIWTNTLKKVTDMPIQHISAYHLTVERKTKLFLLREKGQFKEINESVSAAQFEELLHFAEENAFIQYEISNFGKENFFSRHNSNYWKQVKYLGIGPSAHSFDANSRQWNVSNNKKYIEEINKGIIPSEKEILSPLDKYNDYIMLSLRTMWGIDLDYIENELSKELKDYCLNNAGKYIDYGMLIREKENIILTNQGKFVSDNIISDIMYSNE